MLLPTIKIMKIGHTIIHNTIRLFIVFIDHKYKKVEYYNRPPIQKSLINYISKEFL